MALEAAFLLLAFWLSRVYLVYRLLSRTEVQFFIRLQLPQYTQSKRQCFTGWIWFPSPSTCTRSVTVVGNSNWARRAVTGFTQGRKKKIFLSHMQSSLSLEKVCIPQGMYWYMNKGQWCHIRQCWARQCPPRRTQKTDGSFWIIKLSITWRKQTSVTAFNDPLEPPSIFTAH